MHLREGDQWVPVRVLTAFGEGVGGVFLVVRRLTDGQRLMWRVDGSLHEVPG
jgi:hypothetical protein